MARYDQIDYWDDRYANDTQPFEWYQSYSGIRHFFTPKYLQQSKNENTSSITCPHIDRALIVGCGNSQLGQGMLGDGFKSITNVDFSSVLIKQMTTKYSEQWHREFFKRQREEKRLEKEEGSSPKPSLTDLNKHTRLSKQSPAKEVNKTTIGNKMTFHWHDVAKKLEFPPESFDLIVCKGTLDAILCNQNASNKVKMMLSECHRVLDDRHGVMVIVSYGAPDERMDCFDNVLWSEIKSYTVPKPFVPGQNHQVGAEHHVYILFKRAGLGSASPRHVGAELAV
ncbi:hypothetical protein ACHAXN_009585 [Cyclotella atomus]